MVPRGALIAALEQQLGRRLTQEHRHYLGNQPVHCGDILELRKNGQWLSVRYEWSGNPDELSVFISDDGGVPLDEASRLRWPSA